MNNELFTIFTGDISNGAFIRIGANRNIGLYIGKSKEGNYAFEYRGQYEPVRLKESEVISVRQWAVEGTYALRFNLCNNELIECFCIFCKDLLDSTVSINDDAIAYKTLCGRYNSWKKLFKPHVGKLSDAEIMGLTGELLFLRDKMIPKYGVHKAIESWMGPEKYHKDFSISDFWYEVKAIGSGKHEVNISSLEQLDSSDNGYLAVYQLEKMSPAYDGIKLSQLVASLMGGIQTVEDKEAFMSKLSLYDYDMSSDYDDCVYAISDFSIYLVDGEFPRLSRKDMPEAIGDVQYSINLSEINKLII